MQTNIQRITPFLWFDNQAEEAVNFYTSIFHNSQIGFFGENAKFWAYVALLLGAMRGLAPGSERPALLAVKPYFGMMAGGWLVYACLNLLLLRDMALRHSSVVHPGWNAFAVQVFLGLVLLPVAWAFSVRTFPLYLRLAVPDWPVRGFAYMYLCAWFLHALPTAPVVFTLAPSIALALAHVGLVGKGGVIVWFVWKLDVLTHYQEPWTGRRRLHPSPSPYSTRVARLRRVWPI